MFLFAADRVRCIDDHTISLLSLCPVKRPFHHVDGRWQRPAGGTVGELSVAWGFFPLVRRAQSPIDIQQELLYIPVECQ
jgi:hypothetical protein